MTNIGTVDGPNPALIEKGHWIEFLITDKDSGKPVKGVEVRVAFGDGTSGACGTWAGGRAHFEVIPGGPCDLRECWKGHALLESKESHILKDGDSLQGIADCSVKKGNDISWQDIAAFNWGEDARRLFVANRRMRDLFGCTRYGFNQHMVYSERPGETHRIDIPEKIVRKGLAIDQVHEIRVNAASTPEQFFGCACMPAMTFETRASFVRPYAAEHLARLKTLMDGEPKGRLMVFGHSEAEETQEKSKALSERRAESVYALLTRNTDIWLGFFKEEDWGARAVQIMLNRLTPDAKLDLSGRLDDGTVKELEKQTGQACARTFFGWAWTDGVLAALFKKYMDRVAEGFVLDDSRFVSLKHTGCAAFNRLDDDGDADGGNGRVVLCLFNPEQLPAFPCAPKDTKPCEAQSAQYDREKGRVFRHCRTFRCAFYDSLARECPCETTFPDIIALDGHMHFMSAHTTPMPLLWNQIPMNNGGRVRPSRSGFEELGENLVGTGASRGARMGSKKTLDIADTGIKENHLIYDRLFARELKKGRSRKKLTPMIPMPMDMEFAHLDGYKGKPIYIKVPERHSYMKKVINLSSSKKKPALGYVRTTLWPDDVANELKGFEETYSRVKAREKLGDNDITTQTRGSKKQVNEGFYYYYDRKTENMGICSQSDKTPRWLHWEEMDLFENWDKQYKETIMAAVSHPFQYFPMYHYEPRRWASIKEGHVAHADPETKSEPLFPWGWDIPFNDIATPERAGVFIGFKMYTALGYRPDDYRIWGTAGQAHLPAMLLFYGRCEKEGIPILCHCSPSGMCTHDIRLYADLDKPRYKQGDPKVWYYDHFVSPWAWLPVLMDFRTLRLCLAHFGGGSSDWWYWKTNTIGKIWEQRNPSDTAIKSSEPTEEDIDRIISAWYERKNEETGRYSWIRQIVDLMERTNGDGSSAFPNLFTDISYHFIRDHGRELVWLIVHHPVVKERILFGTDWYMTELDKKSYETMAGESKKALDELSLNLAEKTGDYVDLWQTFSRTNPMAFFRIRSVADNFAEGLKAQLSEKDKEKLTETISDVMDIIKKSDLS